MAFKFLKDLKVNEELRKELSGPFGVVMSLDQLAQKINEMDITYAIGDATVATLLRLGCTPKVAIFDNMVARERISLPIIKATYTNPISVKNPKGMLGIELWNAVRKAGRAKTATGIEVDGEEDLGSLACAYFAKPGEVMAYGLRDRGIVVITIDDKMKRYLESVLKRMLEISQ